MPGLERGKGDQQLVVVAITFDRRIVGIRAIMVGTRDIAKKGKPTTYLGDARVVVSRSECGSGGEFVPGLPQQCGQGAARRDQFLVGWR